jgi:hypothetical protein
VESKLANARKGGRCPSLRVRGASCMRTSGVKRGKKYTPVSVAGAE